MEISVDVAIIGAGTAGISAFKEASKKTNKIVMIDHGPLGTTCARVGCMPSKAFIQVANYFYNRHFFSERGITGATQLKIHIPEVLNYVRKMRDHFTYGITQYLESLNDKFMIGSAEVCEPNVIKINNHKIIAKKIIIATGTESIVPASWGSPSNEILTSENFFDQLDFTTKIVRIGAGVIGLELGQALSRCGINISIFHAQNTIAKLSDPQVNNYAINVIQEEFPLYLNYKAQLEKKNNAFIIKGETESIETKQILAALGRKPNLVNINFEKLE